MSRRYKPGGRWMVVTEGIVSRHRSRGEARRTARHYSVLGARVRRYRRELVHVDEDGMMWRKS